MTERRPVVVDAFVQALREAGWELLFAEGADHGLVEGARHRDYPKKVKLRAGELGLWLEEWEKQGRPSDFTPPPF